MVSEDGRVPPELSRAASLYNRGIPGSWADMMEMPALDRDDVILLSDALATRSARRASQHGQR